MATKEELQKQLELQDQLYQNNIKLQKQLGEIATKQEEINDLVEKRKINAQEMLKFTAQTTEERNLQYDKEKEDFDLAIAKGELFGEERKFRAADLEQKRQMKDLTDDELKSAQALYEVQIKQAKLREENAKSLEKSKKRLGDIAKRMGVILGIGNQVADTFAGGVVVALKDAAVVSRDFAKNIIESDSSMKDLGKSALKTADAVGNLAAGFLLSTAEEVAMGQDRIRSEFIKATGASVEFSNSVIGAADDLREMGLGMDEAGSSAIALYNNVTSFKDANEATRKSAIEFVSQLQMIGVTAQAAAGNMQLMTMGLGQTFEQSVATTNSLINFADSLDMDINQALEDFNDLAPELMKYGAGMDKVFKGLMKISRKTGLSMQALVDVASQFDTFEGAATAVGRLNGMLGGPYLNSIEMVYATEEERLKLMKQAMNNSGRQFKDLSRFEKQSVANAAGFKNVADAMYFFNKEAMDPAARKQYEEQQTLADRAKKTQDIMTKLRNAIHSLTISLEPLIMHLRDAINWLTENSTVTRYLIMSLAGLWAAVKVTMGIQALMPILGGLKTAFVFLTSAVWKNIAAKTVSAAESLYLHGLYAKEAVVLGIKKAALLRASAAQLALNAAMTANPIGLIVIAVVAAIGALYLLYTHFEKVKGAIMSLFEGVATILTAIFSAVMVPIKATINLMIGAINFLVRMANKAIRFIPGVPYVGGSKDWQIEYLAKGTSNFAGGPAIVGEKGPELVYLEKGTTVASNEKTVAAAREAMGVSKKAAAGGGVSAEDLKVAFVAALREVGIGSAGEGKIVAEQPIEVTIGKKVFGRAVMDVVKESTNIRLKPGAR